MRTHVSLAALAFALASQSPASAESLDQAAEARGQTTAASDARLEGEPKRLRELEAVSQAKRDEAADDSDAAWYRKIEIAGLVEVEAWLASPEEGDDESDVTLATVELELSSQINDWVAAGISFLYEENETDLEVDTAFVTLANPAVTPVFLTAGQIYVPFGAFESNLVSDPLTLEVGETREAAVRLGFEQGDFSGSAYVFGGDNKVDGENQIDSWGLNLGYAHTENPNAWAFGAGYINNLGDSDTLRDSVNENRVAYLDEAIAAGDDTRGFSVDPTDHVGGWTLNAAATLGPFNLIGEYLSATEAFDPISLGFQEGGAKPSAWNIEAGYSFAVLGRESTAAIAYQGTDEALALELPEARWLLGWSVEVFEKTTLSLEWAHDEDYDTAEGGTGESTETFTAQLAVAF